MDIRDIVSEDFETFDADARVSELEGFFRETGAKAAVVTEDGDYQGIVTQRQLNASRLSPDAKARGLLWHVGRVTVDDDARTVARLMVGGSTKVLPVFDDETLVGIVTADALLSEVQPFLRVLTVDDVASTDLVSVTPEATLAEALHRLREQGISHLPVVEGNRPVGIVSLFDVIDFAARELQKTQGGSPSPEAQPGGGTSRGGFGNRAGERDRLLDLPVADVMVDRVETTTPETQLDEAVGGMLDAGISSLVVAPDGEPTGIITKTDVLRALTWTDESRLPVQFTNVDLLDDISREEVADMIADVTSKYRDLTVLEANVFLHEHEERLRGTPLLMARIRLFTDKGHFVGTGEGYGASHALHLARNVVERQILEGKEYAQTKKHPTEDELSRMYGWWLTGGG
ncbi:CBS domain-containing protein [Haloarchaeobius sp. HRN-SO-5]|uniref:CBS domain-containing protein n=1 Tax=Haloarchaeobius sp. HRN-SO-5 TaxID=3446118 RepID=UPI003EB8DF85